MPVEKNGIQPIYMHDEKRKSLQQVSKPVVDSLFIFSPSSPSSSPFVLWCLSSAACFHFPFLSSSLVVVASSSLVRRDGHFYRSTEQDEKCARGEDAKEKKKMRRKKRRRRSTCLCQAMVNKNESKKCRGKKIVFRFLSPFFSSCLFVRYHRKISRINHATVKWA